METSTDTLLLILITILSVLTAVALIALITFIMLLRKVLKKANAVVDNVEAVLEETKQKVSKSLNFLSIFKILAKRK